MQECHLQTCDEIAEEVGISPAFAFRILKENLGYQDVAVKWVPHALTAEQKMARINVVQQMQARHATEGDGFLKRIVAIDETWLRAYEPELKATIA